MKLNALTKAEKALLVFLERVCVDNEGIYNIEHLSREDRKIMERWKTQGIIDHGRVAPMHARAGKSVWVKLSRDAIVAAYGFRQERAERAWLDRRWITDAEQLDASEPCESFDEDE